MRNIYIIFALFALILLGNSNKLFAQSGQELIDICGMIAGDDATYLKDFPVKLEAAKPGEEPPKTRFSVVLSKSTEYRFSICNSKDFTGEAVIHIYDNSRLILTNHMVATGKTYPTINFKCSNTGVYHVFVSYKEGKQGMSVVLLSFIGRF